MDCFFNKTLFSRYYQLTQEEAYIVFSQMVEIATECVWKTLEYGTIVTWAVQSDLDSMLKRIFFSLLMICTQPPTMHVDYLHI